MIKCSRDEVLDRVLETDELATLPSSLARILAVTQDPDSTALDLAAEIAQDPALTAHVLKTVNSAFYSFQRRVQSVSDAVVLLGFTEVERLSLAISVINLFGGRQAHAWALSQLWRHSLVASMAVDVVIERYTDGDPDAGGAHVAALLHDLGKAFLWQAFPEAIGDVIRLVDEEGMTPREAEMAVFGGADHAMVGAAVCERWMLPPAIVQSVLMHHDAGALEDGNVLTHAVAVSDAAAYALQAPAMITRRPITVHAPASLEYFGGDETIYTEIGYHLQSRRDLISALAKG
jgi:putative nucleotidyltransferase with HDIG domain